MINAQQTCRLSVRKPLERPKKRRKKRENQNKIISLTDPEDSIDLRFDINDETNTVSLKCAVQNIYPLPVVKLL